MQDALNNLMYTALTAAGVFAVLVVVATVIYRYVKVPHVKA